MKRKDKYRKYQVGDRLTPKQEKFIDYYIETGNCEKSAKMARI